MEIAEALAYAKPIGKGALVTFKADVCPQISNVMFSVRDDELVRVSVAASCAKTTNVRRDPRVSPHVTAPDFWSYVVIEGDVELTPFADDPHDATDDELVTTYRSMAREHKDWDDYRSSMVADGRLVARLHPTYAYGMLPASQQ